MAFPFKGARFIQVKITKKDKHGTATGWPRPLNRGGRLMQVPNTAFVCAKNRDFKKWPLNRGWPLNTGPLYTGSIVCTQLRKPDLIFRMISKHYFLKLQRESNSL